uniref:NERD domain-containing protein n=2 Tax=Neobacillus citreus TaxID=2833578 RepID=A0A942T3B1_9BACI
MLPKDKYMILHDLNLPDDEFNLQIDTLLITPAYALVISVKHMAGKLIIDTENEQFTQIVNEKEKGYPYPVAQVERHQKYIKKLLAAHGFPPLPVEYLIVFSNSYCTYVVSGPNSRKVKLRTCKADVLLNRIEFFEKLYPDPFLTAKELRKLCKLLVKLNTPPTKYLFKKFGLKRSDLLTGVHCPYCGYLPLIRKKQKWYCSRCDKYSADAHMNALMDYFLLYDLKITNKEFREFVHLKSQDVAKRLLHTEKLIYSGENRHRIYFPKTFPW